MKRPNKRLAVRICKDTIFYIRTNKLNVVKGMYFRSGGLTNIFHNRISNLSTVVELKPILEKELNEENSPTRCSVCALGAMFASRVVKDNNCLIQETIATMPGNFEFDKQLLEAFSPTQLNMIEAAFEKRRMDSYQSTYLFRHQLYMKAIEFGKKFVDSKERLIAIMENIVLNRGTFKP
jgi:NADPH-dependent 7-cyano-7-deazaguanine reductase QueF